MYTGPNIVRDDLQQTYNFSSSRCYNNGLTSVDDLITKTTATITNTGTDISYTDGCLTWAGSNTANINILDTGKMALFSLEAWIYNESGGDSRHSLLRNFWEVVGTQICFWSYDFANDYWRCSPTGTVPYDEWTHIITTWDGSVIRHYANGSIAWTDSSTSSGTSQSMYQIAGYSGRKFKGKLASLSVYEKTLSAAEVQQNYNAYKNRFDI
jgi:hypothetical protein